MDELEPMKITVDADTDWRGFHVSWDDDLAAWVAKSERHPGFWAFDPDEPALALTRLGMKIKDAGQ